MNIQNMCRDQWGVRNDEGVTNKIHPAGWHEAKPAQQKTLFVKEEPRPVLVLRVHHVGTNAVSE